MAKPHHGTTPTKLRFSYGVPLLSLFLCIDVILVLVRPFQLTHTVLAYSSRGWDERRSIDLWPYPDISVLGARRPYDAVQPARLLQGKRNASTNFVQIFHYHSIFFEEVHGEPGHGERESNLNLVPIQTFTLFAYRYTRAYYTLAHSSHHAYTYACYLRSRVNRKTRPGGGKLAGNCSHLRAHSYFSFSSQLPKKLPFITKKPAGTNERTNERGSNCGLAKWSVNLNKVTDDVNMKIPPRTGKQFRSCQTTPPVTKCVAACEAGRKEKKTTNALWARVMHANKPVHSWVFGAAQAETKSFSSLEGSEKVWWVEVQADCATDLLT